MTPELQDMYTEGSRLDNRVGIKVHYDKIDLNISLKLPDNCSIFQTEAKVIRQTEDYMFTIDCLLLGLNTYIIGHFNTSVRIIDLVSHITYVVCVNFVHKWRDI